MKFITAFLKSKPKQFYGIKFIFGIILGVLIGHGYYTFTFASAFRAEEETLGRTVYWTMITLFGLGCALSPQCRCIVGLCIPAMVGKTGRGVLNALLATWILSGPIANLMYHSGEVVISMSCLARLQAKQMGNLMHLLHAPVTAGLKQLVDDAKALNDTEEILNRNLDGLKSELWHNDMSDSRSSKIKSLKKDKNIGKKLRDDAVDRCFGVFNYGVEECVRLFRRKEQDCHDTISIPFLKDVLCLVMKSSFLCDAVGWFDGMCNDAPHIDEAQVDQDYEDMSNAGKGVHEEFDTEMEWMVPQRDERTGIITVEEIAERVEASYRKKKLVYDFLTSLVQKIVAISFALVLTSASSYNYSYLTDIRFDNLYISYYFMRKDKERKMKGKRHILPLTKLERRNLIYPTTLKLTVAEKSSMVFKVIKTLGNMLFTGTLFLFDHIIFTILNLIRLHARVDVVIKARHKLEVKVVGNKTVAKLLQRLFAPFEDNDHVLESSTSNIDCLPRPNKLPDSSLSWIMGLYGVLLFTFFLDAYAMRLRHVIAGFCNRRREKSRVIMLYSDLLRKRKNQLDHVRLGVLKLARSHRLMQRHSFWSAFLLKHPEFKAVINWFGLGRLKCLICETKESRKRPLVTCDNPKCKIRYCKICWREVGSMCWACESYKPTEEEIQLRRWQEAHNELYVEEEESSDSGEEEMRVENEFPSSEETSSESV